MLQNLSEYAMHLYSLQWLLLISGNVRFTEHSFQYLIQRLRSLEVEKALLKGISIELVDEIHDLVVIKFRRPIAFILFQERK
jgi:hypothetical protein